MCVALHEHGDIKIKLGLVGVGERSPPCLLGNLQKTVHLMKECVSLVFKVGSTVHQFSVSLGLHRPKDGQGLLIHRGA